MLRRVLPAVALAFGMFAACADDLPQATNAADDGGGAPDAVAPIDEGHDPTGTADGIAPTGDGATDDGGDGDAGLTSDASNDNDSSVPCSARCPTRSCTTNGTCDLIAFVTDEIFTGIFDGGTGAFALDHACQAEADLEHLDAGFIAWAADDNGQLPLDRAGVAHSAYALRNGALVIDDVDKLVGTTPAVPQPIDRNAHGDPVNVGASHQVWTGLFTSASKAPDNCLSWSMADTLHQGQVGVIGSTTITWVDNGSQSCNESNHVYCFQKSP